MAFEALGLKLNTSIKISKGTLHLILRLKFKLLSSVA